MYKHAIVRPPSKSYRRCISSHPNHHELDLELALVQHDQYCTILSEIGLEVIKLPPEDDFPDSCFVEDTAVLHRNKVAISRPAVESRRGEETSIESVIGDYKHTHRVQSPGTIEGGDVIHLDGLLISGITQRTNDEGVRQTADWLEVQIATIRDLDIVHLKSHVTFLGDETFATTKRFATHSLLADYTKILIPEQEAYAANTLACNGFVLMPKGHAESFQSIRNAGFDVLTLDVSEFEKCEGALTCLSILF